MTSDPSVISWGLGQIAVFLKESNGNLHEVWFAGGWQAESSLTAGVTLGSDAHPLSWGPGHIDLFWKGSDSMPAHIWYGSGGWSTAIDSTFGIQVPHRQISQQSVPPL